MVRCLPRSNDLSEVFLRLLDMVDDVEVASIVDRAVIANVGDPLTAGVMARAAIAQNLDRRERKTEALPRSAVRLKLGDILPIVRHDASIAQAAWVIYRYLLDPPVQDDERPDLVRRMYSNEDDDERDQLEREAIASKGELDRAKAEEARGEAEDDENEDDERDNTNEVGRDTVAQDAAALARLIRLAGMMRSD